MNPTFIRAFLISSLTIITVQESNAEQRLPNLNIQPPVWGGQGWNINQVPIAWGDCVPIPVVPMPFGYSNMPMVNAPLTITPYPAPMNMPPIMPPLSPFYDAAPAPVITNIAPLAPDNSKLNALQTEYNQRTTASNNKIEEISQALKDSKLQMADATLIIDKLSKESAGITAENTALKEQLLNLSNSNKSLKGKLATIESTVGDQARKITVLNQSTSELVALKSAYKTRNNENAALKKKLANLNSTLKTLKARFSTAQTEAGSQARKLTVLNQASIELKALRSAYKTRNNENAALKKELADLDSAFKTLKAKLSTAQTEAESQARKLTALNQASIELKALKSAYKTRNNENAALKKQLADLDSAFKTLKAKLSTVQTEAESQARKLTALNQASIELKALKSTYKERNAESAGLKAKLGEINNAYKARNDENIALKKELANLEEANKSLQAKLSLATKDASSQARKIAVLEQSATELTAIQSAYKEKINENISLKTRIEEIDTLKAALASCNDKESSCGLNLTNADNKRKSLLEQIAGLEKKVADQAQKITSFSGMTNKLAALKSTYKDLTVKLAEATADTDKDGVLNSTDQCPNSPLDLEVNATGCPADADNDGVTNSKDECPASPIGSAVNEKGCPKIADADGDSIADASDLCPSTPSGTEVNEFGCEPTQNITLDSVNFATGSAHLTEDSFPILSAIAITLNKNPALKIEISGYTDNQGGKAINKQLSQRRANSVMIQLIRNGVAANRLIAKGYGELNPISTNNTVEGRATNRRVELKIRK